MVTMELIVTTLHTDGDLITHLHLSLDTFQTNIFEPFKLTIIVLSLKGQETSTEPEPVSPQTRSYLSALRCCLTMLEPGPWTS